MRLLFSVERISLLFYKSISSIFKRSSIYLCYESSFHFHFHLFRRLPFAPVPRKFFTRAPWRRVQKRNPLRFARRNLFGVARAYERLEGQRLDKPRFQAFETARKKAVQNFG